MTNSKKEKHKAAHRFEVLTLNNNKTTMNTREPQLFQPSPKKILISGEETGLRPLTDHVTERMGMFN